MPPISHVNGRYYRNEALEPSGKQPLTPKDRQRLVELHFERGAERQLHADANLAAALRLGVQFRALKEQG